MFIIVLGIFTCIGQKLAILKLKENAEIDVKILWINSVTFISGFAYLLAHKNVEEVTTISEGCPMLNYKGLDVPGINKTHGIVLDFGSLGSIQMLIALNVLFFTIFTLLLLQRTE